MIVHILSLRAFSDPWFWALLITLWALQTRAALGVAPEVFRAVQKGAGAPEALGQRVRHLAAPARPPTRPGPPLRRAAGTALTAAAAAALGVWGLLFGVELAQALLVLAMPHAIGAALEGATRARLAALAAAPATTPAALGRAAAPLLAAHRARMRRLALMSVLAALLATEAGYLPFPPLWGH